MVYNSIFLVVVDKRVEGLRFIGPINRSKAGNWHECGRYGCRAFLQSPPRIDELNIHEWRRTHTREALLVKNVQTIYGENGAKKDAEEAWEERGTMRFAQGRHFENLLTLLTR